MNVKLAYPKEESDSRQSYKHPTLLPVGTMEDVIWLGFRDEDRPVSVEITRDRLMVTLQDGRIVGSPLEWYPPLCEATAKQYVDVTLGKNNLRWSALGLEIFTRDLLIGRKPSPTVTE